MKARERLRYIADTLDREPSMWPEAAACLRALATRFDEEEERATRRHRNWVAAGLAHFAALAQTEVELLARLDAPLVKSESGAS